MVDRIIRNKKVLFLHRLKIFFSDTDINLVCKENDRFDAVYLLLYYYYGGCIYSALKKFERALFFFEVSN